MTNLLFLIVIFLSNAIQAITGFAGTLLAMPFSILLVGIDDAKVVLAFMALLSCLIISAQNKQHIDKREVVKICAYMIVGMIVGVAIYAVLPVDILLPIYGTIVILVGLKNMFVKKEIKLSKIAGIIVLFLAGIIHGMFVSGGALLVIYAVVVLRDKNTFRATVATIWVILDAILFVGYIFDGIVTMSNVYLIAISIIPLFVATYVGSKLQAKIPQAAFLKLTYILLILSGISIL